MNSALCLVLNFAIFTYCLAVAVSLQEQDPEATDGYFEGDIILDSLSRSVIKAPAKRWPNNIICYRLDWKFTAAQRADILNAMHNISSQSFVQFRKAPPKRIDCVSINLIAAGNGCNADAGYLGRKQNINLSNATSGTGCFSQGKLMHELLHTCGFFHQHNAPDRDQYITIKWENILPKKQLYFAKNTLAESTSFGIPYDCGSIMHYGPTAFSSNGLATIEPKANCTGIGQREKLSDSDIAKLNFMYPAKKSVGIVANGYNSIQTEYYEDLNKTFGENVKLYN